MALIHDKAVYHVSKKVSLNLRLFRQKCRAAHIVSLSEQHHGQSHLLTSSGRLGAKPPARYRADGIDAMNAMRLRKCTAKKALVRLNR